MKTIWTVTVLVLWVGVSLPVGADSAPVVAAAIQGNVTTPPSGAAQPRVTDRMAVVTGDVLNLRSGPSVSDSIVAKAKQGAKLHILEGPKDGWYKVKTDRDTVGWVHGDYVRIQAEDEKRAEAEISINRKLKEPDLEARHRAAEALRTLVEERAVGALVTCLKDEWWEVRRAAAVLLGHVGYRRAVDPLVACLKDEDRDVRISAAWASERLGYKPATEEARSAFLAAKREREQLARKAAAAVEQLIACLKDEDSDVRYKAMDALGKLGDARAVEPLIACLKEDPYGYRAAHALGVLGDRRAVKPLIACLLEDVNSEMAAQALGMLSDARAVEPLIGCLKHKYTGERASAAEALGKLGDARAVEPLIACLLKDEVEGVQVSVAHALAMLGDARAVEPLIACLSKDKHGWVRECAVRALGNLGDARAVEPITACLKDGYLSAHMAADETLKKLGSPPDVVGSLMARGNDIPEVLLSTVVVLGNLGDARAVEPLITVLTREAVKDWPQDWRWLASGSAEDPWVREAVARVLGKLGDTRAVEPLIALLKEEDLKVHLSAARALERLGYKPATAEARVTFLLAKRDWKQLAQEAPEAVDTLIACLKDDKQWVRRNAAEALGVLGDERAVEPLLVLQEEANYADLQEAASEALGRLRHTENVVKPGPSLIESSIAILRDQARGNNQPQHPEGGRPYNEISEKLWRLGEAAVAPLIAWLKDEHVGVRATAAEALGKMGDTRAVEALIACLKDESEWVREAAAEALGRLAYPPDRAGFYDLEEEEDEG